MARLAQSRNVGRYSRGEDEARDEPRPLRLACRRSTLVSLTGPVHGDRAVKKGSGLGDKIAQIQGATKEAVDAIGGITATIEEVSRIATSIGAAIEEQGAATAEIARSVSQTAEATREVTTNIGGVSTAANETGNAAGMVLAAASNLSKQAEQLSGEVGTFLAGVRAA